MADTRVGMSVAQGGKGVALRNSKPLISLGLPISLGQSPAQGTFCTLFLTTNHDAAYDNATVLFYVEQFGRPAFFSEVTISPTDNANLPQLQYTAGTCAADAWSAYIVLNNGVLPAVSLDSALVASGVENIPAGGGGGGGTVTSVTATLPLLSSGGTTPDISIEAGAGNTVLATDSGGVVSFLAPGGDLSGGIDAVRVVGAQLGETGALTFSAATGVITWADTATSPGLAQLLTAAASPVPMILTPQTSVNANADGSTLTVALSAPSGTGVPGVFDVTAGGSFVGAIGAIEFESLTTSALFLFPGISPSGSAKAALLSNSNGTYLQDSDTGFCGLNTATQGTMLWARAGTVEVTVLPGFNFGINADGGAYGGGAGVVGISFASTDPVASETGGAIVYATSDLYGSSGLEALAFFPPTATAASRPTIALVRNGAVGEGIITSNTAPFLIGPIGNAATGVAGAGMSLQAGKGDGVSTNGGDLKLSVGAAGGTGAAGNFIFDNATTSGSATTGTLTPPALVQTFWEVTVGGTVYKIALFNP
jgi:hypothetical protein